MSPHQGVLGFLQTVGNFPMAGFSIRVLSRVRCSSGGRGGGGVKIDEEIFWPAEVGKQHIGLLPFIYHCSFGRISCYIVYRFLFVLEAPRRRRQACQRQESRTFCWTGIIVIHGVFFTVSIMVYHFVCFYHCFLVFRGPSARMPGQGPPQGLQKTTTNSKHKRWISYNYKEVE